MNLTKAAAIIALIVTLIAAGDLLYVLYQEKVELKFELEVLDCAKCRAAKGAAIANWEYVESHIELLDQQHKYAEEVAFQKQHASERPVNTDLPCPNCDLTGPDYTTPGAIAVVGLIVTLALFGATNRKTES
jgi:hypothetical protein